jgi:glyoxylase-like metal-dependent hydrolase (beta-lactamase superfamily II)
MGSNSTGVTGKDKVRMAFTVQVGRVRCHILSDGQTPVDGGGFFGLIPRVMWQRVIEPNEQNQVPADARSLLIEADAGLVLVDTGIGDKLKGKQRQIVGLDDHHDRLLRELGRVGYRPEDVAVVILTHLHMDHAGGATRWHSANELHGSTIPTFPKARYLVQRLELADASYPNERTAATYLVENWQVLVAEGRLEVVDGPQQICATIRTDMTPGHTAGIQAVWVEDGGESLLFLGDACSWAAHMNRLAWVPAFDIYPMTSIETKRRLQHEALRREALLVFQHDARVITGRLVQGARGPEVQPELEKDPWLDVARVLEGES